MKRWFVTLIAAAALGCELSPVVTVPAEPAGGRYADCDRAAQDYCEHVIEAKAKDMDACIAKYRFECVSTRARTGARGRDAG
jgi:hypothetical protein